MRLFTRVLLLAAFAGLVVLGTCFTTLNAEKVGVDFVFGKLPEVEVWVVTLGAFTLGLVFALLVAGTELFRTSLLARRYRKQIRLNGVTRCDQLFLPAWHPSARCWWAPP